jgi:drug/metabolite transporter (DMT)-like permease
MTVAENAYKWFQRNVQNIIPDDELERIEEGKTGAKLEAVVPKEKAPLYKFAYVSMSNVTSTFCMYEALKYVSFTTTVVGRSMKIIPVMLMGVALNGQSYPSKEYMIGIAITFGVLVFKFGDINTQFAAKHPGHKRGADEYRAGTNARTSEAIETTKAKNQRQLSGIVGAAAAMALDAVDNVNPYTHALTSIQSGDY